MLPLPHQLDCDLLLLDLKGDLNGALERVGEGLEERRVAAGPRAAIAAAAGYGGP
jgi:hypothetical protein